MIITPLKFVLEDKTQRLRIANDMLDDNIDSFQGPIIPSITFYAGKE